MALPLNVKLITEAGKVDTVINAKLTPEGRVIVPKTFPLTSIDFKDHVDVTQDGEYEIDGFIFRIKNALKNVGQKAVPKKTSFVNIKYYKPGLFIVTVGLLRRKELFALRFDSLEPFNPHDNMYNF